MFLYTLKGSSQHYLLYLLKEFRLEMNNKRINDIINFPQHYGFKLVECQIYAMVSHSTLWIIIGTNALTSITGTDLAFTVFRHLVMLILFHLVEKTGPQYF